MKRRNFINIFLGSSLSGVVAFFLYPIIRFIIPAKQTQTDIRSTTAAKVGDLAPNTHKIFKFGTSPGILIHTEEGELIAFSAICSHLTCSVLFESDTQTLLCPCHNGKFDLSGNVISGPPPAPLESFDVEISGEDIVISKKG
jgi:cytochrome b6-f complex iron-sulfur subunit